IKIIGKGTFPMYPLPKKAKEEGKPVIGRPSV
ncbi:unnamed protein product, partial [marine sediment metagenome]